MGSEPWKVELERLRSLSKAGLLSMSQVDWLFTVIDEARELGKELICEARELKKALDAETEKRCAANLYWQNRSDEESRATAELRAENARLLDSNEELHRERSMQPGLAYEVAELKAENARLREALTRISTLTVGKVLDDAAFNRSQVCEAVSTARDALEGKEP